MTTTNLNVLGFATQTVSFTKAMSGSEKRREEAWSSCVLEVSEAAVEDWKRSSVPAAMYRDWMLSLRRPGCSRRWMRVRDWAFRGGRDCTAGWHRTPGGSLTVPGMIG